MPPRAIRSSVSRTILSGSVASFVLTPSAVLIEEEDQVDRLGELGPARIVGVEAEPAVLRVELLGELLDALGRRGPRQRQLALAARGLEPLRHGLGHGVGRLLDLGLLRRPRPWPPR